MSFQQLQKTVLIIEDDADTRLLLSAILDHQGIKTTTATGGLDALSKLESEPLPDLILTDLEMKGMDGAALIQILKQSTRTKNIPVILSSGHVNTVEQAQDMGVQGCLCKPYGIETTMALVNSLLTKNSCPALT